MSLEVVTPPDGWPVTLTVAKEHVRQDLEVDDLEIVQMLEAAVEHAQEYQGLQYLTATYDEFFDCFPRGVLTLGLEPVQSITSITYLDTSGDLQTWSSALWQSDLRSSPARIMPVPDESWPLTEARRMSAVTVRFVAGYGNMAQVPPDIRNGFLMKLADLYVNRGDSVGDKRSEAAANMLSPKRNITV